MVSPFAIRVTLGRRLSVRRRLGHHGHHVAWKRSPRGVQRRTSLLGRNYSRFLFSFYECPPYLSINVWVRSPNRPESPRVRRLASWGVPAARRNSCSCSMRGDSTGRREHPTGLTASTRTFADDLHLQSAGSTTGVEETIRPGTDQSEAGSRPTQSRRQATRTREERASHVALVVSESNVRVVARRPQLARRGLGVRRGPPTARRHVVGRQ